MKNITKWVTDNKVAVAWFLWKHYQTESNREGVSLPKGWDNEKYWDNLPIPTLRRWWNENKFPLKFKRNEKVAKRRRNRRYYLHKLLKAQGIKTNNRSRTIYCQNISNPVIKELLEDFGYNVQTDLFTPYKVGLAPIEGEGSFVGAEIKLSKGYE